MKQLLSSFSNNIKEQEKLRVKSNGKKVKATPVTGRGGP
jgi:hypothetical protein